MRDTSEYRSGHLNGAENFPSTEFIDPAYTQNIFYSHLHCSTLIVHCGRSHHRGPTCARHIRSAKERYAAEHKVDPSALPEM